MRKTVIYLCLSAVILACLCGCGTINDKNVPNGYVSKKTYYDTESFQDYTDYCIYYYNDASSVVSNAKFKAVKPDENGKTAFVDDVKHAVEEFIGWMRTLERENELEFSLEDITENDYAYLKENLSYSITLYYFDAETNTLHYMHSNT